MDSISRADGFGAAEVLILLNGQEPETEELLKEYARKFGNIKYIASPRQPRGKARNQLCGRATGDYFYFLDDDVVVEKNVFSVLRRSIAAHKGICVFGGPNLTPADSNLFQQCQGHVLASFFGTLWMNQRYRKDGQARFVNERALILCNLVIAKKIFMEHQFQEDLVSAEENILLQRLSRQGYQALFLPELVVYHQRRSSYVSFCRQIFEYGHGRCQIMKALPGAHGLPNLLPGLLWVLLFFARVPAARGLLLLYGILCAGAALSVGLKHKRPGALAWSLVLFPTTHLSYGAGFVFALLPALTIRALVPFQKFFSRGIL